MGECKSSGNKQICKSLHELLTECFTSESANMPTCNRFLMSLPLEQFLSAVLLRIFSIQNFVPRTLLSLRDVGCRFLLGYNALQVQFADTLKQSTPRTIYMLRISQGKRGRNLCQQPPKFLLAVQQSVSSQILPVTGQKIECKEARRISTAKHQ